MSLICTFVLFLTTSLPLVAQTIRPVLSEFRGHANGRFELVNDTFVPINVVLEPKSFSVSETGEISYRPLDPGIQVKFSTMSFRIQPKQTYAVTYQAKAANLPSYFVVYASLSGMPIRTGTGMNIRLQLPHTIYILGKKDAAKSEIEVVNARYDKQNRKVVLDLASHSSNFGRVLATEVHGNRKKTEAPGFPIYPGKHRKIEVEWNESSPPEKVSFYFKDFKIEAPVKSE